MAIYVAATGSAAVSASRSPAITFSSYTPTTDDVVVFCCNNGAAAAAQTTSTGWVNCHPSGGNTNVASDSHTMTVVYHLVTSAEAAAVTTTYTATTLWNANATGNVVGIVLRGVDTAAVVDSSNTAFSSANGATPHTLPSLTGANLSTYSLDVGFVTADLLATWTTPAGWTAAVSSNTNAGTAILLGDVLTAAATNIAATNITPSAGDEYASYSVAFTALTPLSKAAELSDTFTVKDVGKWIVQSTEADITGGRVVLSPTAAPAAIVESRNNYDLTSSWMLTECTQVSIHTIFEACITGSSGADGAAFHITGGTLSFEEYTGGGSLDAGTPITYSATAHRWLRVTAPGGLVVWQTSPDGKAWTTQRTKTAGQSYAAVYAQLWAVDGGSSIFDNYNLPPAVGRHFSRQSILRASLR